LLLTAEIGNGLRRFSLVGGIQMAKVVVESGLIFGAVVPDAYLIPGMDSEGLGSMLRFIPCGQAREWKSLN
jgi:hypothetical protein